MSWQRIDENTYIDDTLVTCVEYQLFIDEMREQGKYCQPDHWTSYQFPEGRAREPILGVRYSDFEVFCEWVAQREMSEWNYRLPTPEEVVKYSLRSLPQTLCAVWVRADNDQPRFIWIGSVPNNPRAIDFSQILNRVNIHDGANISIFNHALDLDRTSALDRARALGRTHGRDLARVLSRTLYRNLAFDHSLILDRTIGLVIDCVLDFDRALNSFGRTSALTFARNLNLDLYIDLFTLQERIAGRSPAFEGIRLVKERIK